MPALFLLIVMVASLAAQERPSLLEKMVQPKLSLEAVRLAESGIAGYDAKVSTGKYDVKINNAFGGINYARWRFSWEDEESLPFYRGKAPIEQMNQFRVFGNFFRRLDPRWNMLLSVNMNATYERELDGNALGGGLFGFFAYKIDNDHSLQMGAFVNYHPITTLALPVIGYSYRARADDGFTAVVGFPRAFAGYHVAPGVLLRAGFIFSQAVIRLADNSGIEPRGYLEAQDYQASTGLRLTPSERWEFSSDLLYAFRREIHLYDHAADTLESYRIKPSAGLMFKLTYLFR